MTVTPLDPSDVTTLRELTRTEAGAKQRDRYRAVLLAAEGDEEGVELEGDQIARRLGRSPRFVDQWLARYRVGGLDGLRPRKAKGRTPKLDAAQQQAFRSSATLAPTVNTAYMNEHLRFIGSQVAPGAHAILVLDQAGWHVAKGLVTPANVTLLHLPPYSPELNPAERVWAYLRSHYLSNRVYKDYNALFDIAAAAWNRLDEARPKSICHTAWIERANEWEAYQST